MIILNYSHPLSAAQKEQIETLTRQTISALHETLPHFSRDRPITEQVGQLLADTPLTPAQWQTEAILINPPGLAAAASALLAHAHGRMGYFPATIYIRPVADSVPVRYEVAEIMNLQAVRETARSLRNQS